MIPLILVLLSGCESTGRETVMDTPRPHRLNAPDAAYHLTLEQRAGIRPGMDPDRVEHLLSWLPPEQRAAMLVNFTVPPDPEYVPGHPVRVSVPNVVSFNDPVLDAELEAIWAPRWATATDQDLLDQQLPLPGLDKERQRRHLSIRKSGSEP